MARTIDVVELQGKHYDADSGVLLKHAKPKPAQPKKINVIYHDSPHDAKSIRVVHKRTEHAKTLMRQAVKKPAAVSHKIPVHHVAHRSKTYHMEPDPHRVMRAQQTIKHHAVSRFGHAGSHRLAPSQPTRAVVTEIPVRPEPEQAPKPIETPADHTAHHHQQHTFQQAIDRADSHRQPPHKHKSRRHRAAHKLGVSPAVFSLSAAGLMLVLLIGLIAYQNVTDMGMRLASARAGVPAKLPAYQPDGFGLSGPIQYRPGQISLNFQSRSDSRQFRVNQRTSSWDEDTLVANYLDPGHIYVQARQSDGKTVYIYDEHNATWIKDGVWYQIEGDSSLNSNQLLNLASGL